MEAQEIRSIQIKTPLVVGATNGVPDTERRAACNYVKFGDKYIYPFPDVKLKQSCSEERGGLCER